MSATCAPGFLFCICTEIQNLVRTGGSVRLLPLPPAERHCGGANVGNLPFVVCRAMNCDSCAGATTTVAGAVGRVPASTPVVRRAAFPSPLVAAALRCEPAVVVVIVLTKQWRYPRCVRVISSLCRCVDQDPLGNEIVCGCPSGTVPTAAAACSSTLTPCPPPACVPCASGTFPSKDGTRCVDRVCVAASTTRFCRWLQSAPPLAALH